MFTDNNPLTSLLTTAKLDATGQRRVASLTNYNCKLHYKSGNLIVEADPWEWEEALHTLNPIAVTAIISGGYSGDSSTSEIQFQ